MNKYIGKYRVCLEWDRNTLEPIKDDTYIQCSKDGQIYRVDIGPDEVIQSSLVRS